jgi:ATP-dependent DNA helicase RecQ
MEASLNLFNDGMTIDEIATERGLAVSTIESHLTTFVAAGELDIKKLVPSDRLRTILDTVKLSGQYTAAKPIKDLLPADYTFGEIRMVLEYYKRLQR